MMKKIEKEFTDKERTRLISVLDGVRARMERNIDYYGAKYSPEDEANVLVVDKLIQKLKVKK